MSEVNITGSNFDTEVLQSPIPVLLDFWAGWCGPCQRLAPVLDEIAKENEGRLTVGKVNIDEEPQLAARYHVMSIPTLIVFRGGRPQGRSTGAVPKREVLALLNE